MSFLLSVYSYGYYELSRYIYLEIHVSQDTFTVRNITSFLHLDIKGLTVHTPVIGWLKTPLLRLIPELSTGAQR